jgi:polyphosphate kinase
MRQRLTEMIANEGAKAQAGRPARLLFKMNSLVDPDIICALYDASRAGVKVDLIVRGICCLRPGVEGMSDNIRVVSVVGRFLEHSRAYYFENGSEDGKRPALYLGSADLMQRNLDRRVEVLFPIEDPELLTSIRDEILEVELHDTMKAWQLSSEGSWMRVEPKDGAEQVSAQLRFLEVRREVIDAEAAKIPEVKFAPASIFPPL